VARYSTLHDFLPRLGFFIGNEDRIPLDFHKLLAMLAPRPVLIMAPELDRHSRLTDVTRAVEFARVVYELHGAREKLHQYSPVDYNRLAERHQAKLVDWMTKEMK
jgi:hypothetical protein